MAQLNRIHRVIRILELLSMGRKLTCTELYETFDRQVSLRTIQRDMLTIQDAGIPLLTEKEFSKENVWYFPREYRHMIMPSIQQNELMAFYMLKAYLNTFRGTQLAEHLESLLDKLEDMAPGEVYLYLEDHQDILWSQDFGHYDYQSQDAILNTVLEFIRDEHWVTVTYRALSQSYTKTYDVFMYRLFTYKGLIYIAAYNPLHDNYISLALHRIKHIEQAKNQQRQVPPFSVEEFREKRFGVFSGEVETVKLEVKSEYKKYFVNRFWHPSQRNEMQPDGSLIMELQVPVSPELVSWILGWHEAIKVMSPQSLIQEIKNKVEAVACMYKMGE